MSLPLVDDSPTKIDMDPYRMAAPRREPPPRPGFVIPIVERLRPNDRLGEVLIFLGIVLPLTVLGTLLLSR